MKSDAIRQQEIGLSVGKIAVIKITVIAVFSFILCRAEILGAISPFAAAFTAAMPLKYGCITVLGSLMGYLASGLTQNHLLYLMMMAFVMLGKVVFQRIKFIRHPAFLSILTLLSSLSVNFAADFVLDFTAMDLTLRICESILAGGFTFFFTLAAGAWFRSDSIKQYSPAELMSLSILALTGIVALMDITVFGFRLGLIAGALAIYIVIYQFGAIGGAVGGILVSLAFNLYSTEFLYLSGIITVCALVAGVFQPVGRLVQTAVFLSMSLFGVFIVGINLDKLFFLMDIIIAAGIFFMIPKRAFSVFDTAGLKVRIDHGMKDNIESRLNFAAQTISDLQSSLEQVSVKLNKVNTGDVGVIYHKTSNYVCQSCGLNMFCWVDHYNDTIDSFQKMLGILKQKGSLTGTDLEENHIFNCCKKNLLTQKFTQYYNEFLTTENARKRVGEVRSLALEQLSGVSQMLWEVSDEISDMKENDNALAQIVYDIFENLVGTPQSVFCTLNQYGRIEIDIYVLSGTEFDGEELCRAVSRGLSREFELPSVIQAKNKLRISFYEKANFSVEFGASQIASEATQIEEQSDLCGDSYEYFRDSKGNVFLILSDGMGVGKRASLDSTMTCSMILKLIRAGFGMDSIIKFVNSSLQAKSVDESLSTIDIAKIDLYTGQVQFYKAGSASSFVKINHILGEVKTSSLPVGILQGVEFDKKILQLSADDMVVLVSDGVIADDERIVKNTISKYNRLSAGELADKICESVLLTSDGHHDDMTVLVAKIKPGVS